MQPFVSTDDLLFELRGRVESRRVLEPIADVPRMEISFSGKLLESAVLGPGSGACTFEARANPNGVYEWTGRGILFLQAGSVTSISLGLGHREGTSLVYCGKITFKGHSSDVAWLDACTARFEYRQDMESLETRFSCHRDVEASELTITPSPSLKGN